MNDERITFDSIEQAVEALCVETFGALPSYPVKELERHYRMLQEGETIIEGDEFLVGDDWTMSECCGSLVNYGTVGRYRRPIDAPENDKCTDGGTCGIGGYCPECPHGESDGPGCPISAMRSDERSTPDTEWQSACCSGESWHRIAERMNHHAGSLECQLGEVREQRDHYIAESNRLAEELKEERKASFREQRDKLVEALQKARERIKYYEPKIVAMEEIDKALNSIEP